MVGGQHLEASQPWSVVLGFGQESIQSSVEEMLPVGSAVSTNSGWIVVEWIPSLWKNSFTRSATVMYWAKLRQRTYHNQIIRCTGQEIRLKKESSLHEQMQ